MTTPRDGVPHSDAGYLDPDREDGFDFDDVDEDFGWESVDDSDLEESDFDDYNDCEDID